jgi:hypothetical protein
MTGWILSLTYIATHCYGEEIYPRKAIAGMWIFRE